MIYRRLRFVKWLSTTPAAGVCTICSREFTVPMNALKKATDAQASLQEQFDTHECEPEDSSEAPARMTDGALFRQEPDEEEDEEEDDRKEEHDDDESDGYSE